MTGASWPERPLDAFGTVARGRSRHRPRNDPSLYGGDIPFIQTAEVKRALLLLSEHEQTYNETGLAQSRLWPRGTVCFTIAANIADSAILDIDACFPDSVVGITVDKESSDIYFVKYAIDYVRERMRASSRGTTQDNLALDKLLSIPISYPSRETQRRIGKALAEVDLLAERNLAGARRLDQVGDVVFARTFLADQSAHWGPLLDTIELHKGSEPGADAYISVDDAGAVPFARVKDLENDFLQCEVGVDTATEGLKLATPEDVLTSFDGTPGRVATGFQCAISSGIRIAKALDPEWATPGFIYFLMRSSPIQQTIDAHATGTTILHASSSIAELRCPVVNSPAARTAAAILDRLAQLLVIKKMQAALLVRIRSLMLPQLFAGGWVAPSTTANAIDHVFAY